MSVTVFLSNTNIQIAVGSGSQNGAKVSNLISMALPNGAVLNGVITDSAALTGAIRECWKTHKIPKSDVMLVLNSPQLRANRLDTPILPDKKTTEYVNRETKDSEYGRFTDPVTGWYFISKDTKGKIQKIISETAERDFIKAYVDIFGSIGVKLSAIHNGVNLAIRLFGNQARGKTVVYMILDGTSLVTILYAQGEYYYDSTSRVFGQPGTPEFAKEIYGSVSGIRQFASAQHLADTAINEIDFAGLAESQVKRLAEDISEIDNQMIVSQAECPKYIDAGGRTREYPYFVYAVAGLVKVAEKLTILDAAHKTSKAAVDRRGKLKLIIPAVCVAAVMAISAGTLVAIKMSKQKQLDELNKYIRNPAIIEQVNRYDKISGDMSNLGVIQGGVDRLIENQDSYPTPDSKINEEISKAATKHKVTIQFNSYASNSGVFSVTARSKEVDDINAFIAELLRMDIFEKVEYTGYTHISDDAGWSINVVCTLAGKKAETEKSEGVSK